MTRKIPDRHGWGIPDWKKCAYNPRGDGKARVVTGRFRFESGFFFN